MIDEKVKIRCTKCSQVFRERAQKIRNGFQTNCQHCNRLITFDTSSEDRNIRRALMSAKEVRMRLKSGPKTKVWHKALSPNRVIEVFDGSTELALRLTVQPERIFK
jgi:DNA-directed RNA polymerase subunit RPC12/RpoP